LTNTFHPDHHPRGARHNLSLDANGIELPVILIRGASEGKTLVVTAGVHGDEYEGIRAILDLTARLDPRTLRGDLLAVPVANPPAFWNGTRTSPLDAGNLARVFPGTAAGTPTESIAYHLDQHILRHADVYLDLHSAGIACDMPALIGYDASDHRAEQAALAFGADVIWAHPTIPDGRTVSAAKARGIPWLYTEMRGAGRIHPADLQFIERGLRNLLCHLAMIDGTPEPSPCRWRLCGDGNIDHSITATQRGFLIPEVDLLDHVTQGQPIGHLVDLHGTVIERFLAPSEGVVVLIHARPLVTPDEPLFLLAQVAS
jgi:N-alpha-acetyl-L-2,4-diaminobutyrate deacetylase